MKVAIAYLVNIVLAASATLITAATAFGARTVPPAIHLVPFIVPGIAGIAGGFAFGMMVKCQVIRHAGWFSLALLCVLLLFPGLTDVVGSYILMLLITSCTYQWSSARRTLFK